MKRILIFSLSYEPYVGGAEVAIREITSRIDPAEIEFHLVTARFSRKLPSEERIGNVHVYRVGGGSSYLAKILYVPLAAIKAASLHRNLRFESAWAMMAYMVFPLQLMRLFGTRIPYVLTLQEGDPFEHVFKRLRLYPFLPLLKRGFRQAAVVQAISTFLGAWARRAGFSGPLEIIPNGVDVERFSKPYSDAELAPLRAAFDKQEGDVFLITTSRLVHKNAIDDVIRALPALPEHVRFLIVGTGPDEAMLRSLAKRLGVEKQVMFAGYVPYAELPRYLAVSDIFIRPSRSEGMGNSFIEAMAAGMPVIGTMEGGIADFLHDRENGYVVPKDSPDHIAEATRSILAHLSDAKAIGARAKAYVAGRYDWSLIAREMRSRVFDRVG